MRTAEKPLWRAEEAAAATGGRVVGVWTASGLSIDTRTLERGDLFIALKGEARDGHDFVAEALRKGAAAALVSRRPEAVPADAPLLLVKDTQAGLEALGRAARTRARAKIVAVTGSAGKTTTKEMLRTGLSAAGSVAASAASYNNHWGVPLSLARMAPDADYGVFEIGMNHAGEIRALVKQVRPHVAIITTIAPAHLAYFGTVEAIAEAKAEIFEGVEPGGVAILPADNRAFGRLVNKAHAAKVDRILSFGTALDADARLMASEAGGEGQQIVAMVGGRRLVFRMKALGAHIAMNALAALLAAREAGADPDAVMAALASFAPLTGRGARFASGGIEVIDESYNANPASMAAALDLLGQSRPRQAGRRIAVLGDMLELGEDAPRLHRALAQDIARAGVGVVFLCGPNMAALWQALPPERRGAYAPTSVGLAPMLASELREGDVVLVKGSFGSRMAAIIDALKARASAAA